MASGRCAYDSDAEGCMPEHSGTRPCSITQAGRPCRVGSLSFNITLSSTQHTEHCRLSLKTCDRNDSTYHTAIQWLGLEAKQSQDRVHGCWSTSRPTAVSHWNVEKSSKVSVDLHLHAHSLMPHRPVITASIVGKAERKAVESEAIDRNSSRVRNTEAEFLRQRD